MSTTTNTQTAQITVNSLNPNLFRRICLPAGPHVTDDDVRYIVDTIKASIV